MSTDKTGLHHLHRNTFFFYTYFYSRTYSFFYTNNTDTETRCALSTLFKAQNFRYQEITWWPRNDFWYGLKLQLLPTRSHPYEAKKENVPISSIENVNTVISPTTHSLLHNHRVPNAHTNSTIITNFVNPVGDSTIELST